MDTEPLNMPCLRFPGLETLPVTAHERYLLGEDLFLATHSPIRVRRFPNGYQSEDVITEEEILKRILDRDPNRLGNRVFILYGAAGSGKSELMAWLELAMRSRLSVEGSALTRISRTDLDAFHMMERFKHWMDDEHFSATTHQRWEEMRRKPRTFTKILVLQSLEALVESDDLVNALYYRLVDTVEPYVTRFLGAAGANDIHKLDLLSYEDFEQIRKTTVLPVPLDFEQFRHLLVDNLRKHLFEGLQLSDTLHQISETFRNQGIRPILLIDDLVQSINIFADEVLDYFITLENGNWDVVIGLTPASFETDERGRRLLDRITYLDTIDDRVSKLWLSDERGQESYFLTEDNCHLFAQKYLNAMRSHNGLVCSTCPSFLRCSQLSLYDETVLAPFNREVLIRILHSVPDGKGKVRYFLQAIRQILEQIISGKLPEVAISAFARPDIYVEAADDRSRQLLSWYGPLTTELEVPINVMISSFFDLPELPLAPAIHVLTTRHETPNIKSLVSIDEIDPGRLAIRAWILGDAPNRQLFDKLRRGVARWLKSVYPTEYLHRMHTAKPQRVLRFRQVGLGTSPTISFEDLSSDKDIEIIIRREIGQAAFWLSQFSVTTGDESSHLAARLCNDPLMLNVLWKAEQYREQGIEQIENQVGMPLSEFAFHLYALRCAIVGSPSIYPPGFDTDYWANIQLLHRVLRNHLMITEPLRSELVVIESLFSDMFEMRHNVFDGARITELCHQHTALDSIGKLASTQPDNVSSDYYIRGIPFNAFWKSIAETIAKCIRILSESSDPEQAEHLSATAQETVLRWRDAEAIHISGQLTNILKEIELYAPSIYRRLAVILTIE